MPLIENTQRIFKKYDTSSYSKGCCTYMKASEDIIVCIIVHEKERSKGIDKLMMDVYNHKKEDMSIRGSYVGGSLIDFEKFLKKYFKLK